MSGRYPQRVLGGDDSSVWPPSVRGAELFDGYPPPVIATPADAKVSAMHRPHTLHVPTLLGCRGGTPARLGSEAR